MSRLFALPFVSGFFRRLLDRGRILRPQSINGWSSQNSRYWIGTTVVTPLFFAGVGLSSASRSYCSGNASTSSNPDNAVKADSIPGFWKNYLPEELSGVEISSVWENPKSLTEFTWGCFLGSFLGYTCKKTFKMIVLSLGTAFFLLQMGSRLGYIRINWEKVGQDAKEISRRPNSLRDSFWAHYRNSLVFFKENFPASFGFLFGFTVSVLFL
eukprot:Sdes_comp21585_c0_seq1m20188